MIIEPPYNEQEEKANYMKNVKLKRLVELILLKCGISDVFHDLKINEYYRLNIDQPLVHGISVSFKCNSYDITLNSQRLISCTGFLEDMLVALSHQEKTDEDKIVLADGIIRRLYETSKRDEILKQAKEVNHLPAKQEIFEQMCYQRDPHWDEIYNLYMDMINQGYTSERLLKCDSQKHIITIVQKAHEGDPNSIRELLNRYKKKNLKEEYNYWKERLNNKRPTCNNS